MRAVQVWADKVHDRTGSPRPIHTVAFKPDGTQIVAGAGKRVLVYETADGEVISELKGHSDTVYCVSYARDGQRFATGGADAVVIIWTAAMQGMLQYSHNDAIQALAFNPVTGVLASCSKSDFGFWSSDHKNVEKFKVPSRICSCSWTNDGQYLALGLFNGNISIRDRLGEQKILVDRPNAGPAWSLQWNPSTTDKTDVLAVADWNQRLSFYMLSGRQIGKEVVLDYDPCSCSYFSSGDYLVMTGANKKASLHTRSGTFLTEICNQGGWIWSSAARPNQNYVVLGCEDGTIALYQLVFSTVHGLYRDRYAFRKSMTDVVVQDLTTREENKVKCRELVKKIAIYKEHLAVQLPSQINIYTQTELPNGRRKWQLTDRLRQKFECNLLVVCSKHVILCQERRLQSYTFKGVKEREWATDSLIRYIKVVGGPDGREGLLVGQSNGTILKVFVDNAFPIELIKQSTPVRCLDLSASRKKLAVVDENNTCLVYDLATKELLYQEPNANSASWNTQNEDMVCFSGGGNLHIKAANFPLHQQKLPGFVVGFSGSNIYCLHVHSMTTVEVPQSHSMHQYLQKGDFEGAHRVACLGVTEADWRTLALEALEGLNFDIAKRSFARVRETRYLDLIHKIQEQQRVTGSRDADDVLRARICAYQGKFDEAARLYIRADERRKAMEMYTDLRMFDKAKAVMDKSNDADSKYLMKMQAEWCKSANDPTLAIDILNAAGEELASVNMMGENGMVQKLIDKARETNSAETEVLTRIAEWLKKLDQVALAAEVCEKLNDQGLLIDLYVSAKKWNDAFAIANRHPEHLPDIYLPYANWLAENDRFVEAQEAYRLAGMENKAEQVLEILAYNAVVESRFDDASYYHYQLAQGCLQLLESAAGSADEEGTVVAVSHIDQEAVRAKCAAYQLKADLYSAYSAVFRYIEEPFTSHSADVLLHNSRYLLVTLGETVPYGISIFKVLYAAAKLGLQLGAYKLARHAYEKLQAMRIPDTFREHVDTGALSVRSKPVTDSEELQLLCYRCNSHNPLLSQACTVCKHPLVTSVYSREVVPLVEFVPDDDITPEEAARLIADDSGLGTKAGGAFAQGGAQVMSMEDDGGDDDAFVASLAQYENGSAYYEPARADRDMIRGMASSRVFVQPGLDSGPPRYFYSVLPEMAVTMKCGRFFLSDNWELLSLKLGHCPFSREELAPSSSEEKVVLGTQTVSQA